MSKTLVTWVKKTLKPNFFIKFLYHPIISPNLKYWNYSSFINNRNVYQIGNWLRQPYFIFKIKTKKLTKNVIPYKQRFEKETWKIKPC